MTFQELKPLVSTIVANEAFSKEEKLQALKPLLEKGGDHGKSNCS